MIWKSSVSIAIMEYRFLIFSPRNVELGLDEVNKRQKLEHCWLRESGAEQQSAMLETKIRGVEKLPDCF